MKTKLLLLIKNQSLKNIVLAVCFFLISSSAMASHFRYGDISWRIDDNDPTGRTIIFKANTGWACCPGVSLSFNGTSSGYIGSVPQNLTGSANGAQYYSGEVSYTFPANGTYKVWYSGGNKIGGLSNNANGSWYVYTTVNVGTENNSPVTSLPAIVNLQVGTNSNFNIPVADPDGDAVTYRLATSTDGWYGTHPSGLSVSSNGQVSWNTNSTSIGQLWNTAVVIRDSQGAEILVDFIMQITQQSNPPQYDYSITPADGFAYQSSPGQTISFPIEAFDTDPGSTVSITASGMPSGASVSPSFGTASNPINHIFNWTPTPSQFGQFLINFIAQDNNGVQVSTSVSINVSLKPVFDVPPTPISGVHNTIVSPGTLIQYNVQASDPDPLDVVQIISAEGKDMMGMHIPLYTGATFSPLPTVAANPTSGTFNWTPTQAQWGHRHVFFTAQDSYGDQTVHEVNQLVNTPPVFASQPTLTADVGIPYSYTIQVIDPDLDYGDELTIFGNSLPAWLSVIDNGDGTATLTGTPSVSEVGVNIINLQAEDKHHHDDIRGIIFQNFDINVNNCTINVLTVDKTIQLDASGNASITITDINNSSTASCGIASISLSKTAFNCSDIGTNTVTLTVTDNNNNVSTANANVTVLDVLPINAVTDEFTQNTCSPFTFSDADLLGNDVDPYGRDLKIDFVDQPANGTIVDNNNGTYTFTPNSGTNQTFTTTYTVKPNDGTTVFTGNGHFYEFISAPGINWTNAKADAETRSYQGQQGYLVTITSQAENDFAFSKINAQGWIGASDEAIEGQWRWMTGPETGQLFWSGLSNGSSINNAYHAWGGGEPNNAGNEDYAHFRTDGKWNDFPLSVGGSIQGYVIEYGGDTEDCNTQVTATGEINFILNDTVAPILVGIPTDITVECNTVPSVPTITATDNCSTNPLVTFTEERADGFSNNNYTLTRTWSTTDENGNAVSETQNIIVTDSAAPITPNLTDVIGQCEASVSIPTTTDNCSGLITGTTSDPLTYTEQGEYTINWAFEDESGNISTTIQKVIINDTTAPITPVLANVTGQCDATVSVPTTTDNCVSIITGTTSNSLTYTEQGEYQITWTFDDGNGNISTAMQNVTVEDTTAPTAIAKDITVELDASGNTSITTDMVNAGSSDNCGEIILSLNKTNFDCNDFSVSCSDSSISFNGTGIASGANGDNIQNLGLNQLTMEAWVKPNNSSINSIIRKAGDYDLYINNNTLYAEVWYEGRASSAQYLYSGPTVSTNEWSHLAFTFDKANNGSGKFYVNGVETIVSGTTRSIAPDITLGIGGSTEYGQSFNGLIDDVRIWSNERTNAEINEFKDFCIDANSVGLEAYFKIEANEGTTLTDYSGNGNHLTITGTSWSFEGAPIESKAIEVTLTVTDASNNTSSAIANIIVIDPIAPTVVGQDISVTLTASGTVSIVPEDVLDNGSDNCGPVTYTVSQDTFGATDAINSPVTVQLTGTDASGNATTVPVLVTVIDPVPVIITQDITVELDANGVITIDPSQIDNGSSSVVGLSGLALDISSFDCSNVGIPVTVTLTATSTLGSTATGTAIVTVQDNIAPTAISQDITVQLDENGSVSIMPEDINNGSSDNCGIESVTLNQTDFNCSNISSGEIGYSEFLRVNSDNTWKESTVFSPNVNGANNFWNGVLPSQLPSVSTYTKTPSLQNSVVTPIAGTSEIYALNDVRYYRKTFDLNSISNLRISLLGSSDNSIQIFVNGVDVALEGSFVVENFGPPHGRVILEEGTSNTNGGSGYQPFDRITSSTPSALLINGENEIIVAIRNSSGGDRGGFSFQAIFEEIQLPGNQVILTVTDVNGNSSTATANVTVEDNVNPNVITQNVTVQLDPSGNGTTTAELVNNGSSDACGIQSLALDTTSFTCANVGENTVTLTVTDINGNVSMQTAIVTVEDNVNPIANTQNVTVQLDASGNGTTTAVLLDNGSSDACGIQSLVLDTTSFTCADIGLNTVTLTVTDNNGNVSTQTAIVTVEDNVNPIANTQNVTVQLDASGNGTTTAELVDNGSSDACGIQSLALDTTSFTCANVGENTVTLTVTDNNGNVSTQTAIVKVEDNVNPIVVTQNLSVLLDANGNVSITPAMIDNGSFDNCAVASLSLSKDNFDCTNVGANVVTLTVIDVNGNSASNQATVTVSDTINPTAIAQDITVQLDVNGSATITSDDIDNGSFDNCTFTTSLDTTSFDCSNVDIVNTVTLTARDASGNTNATTAIVTVIDAVPAQVITQNIDVFLDENGTTSIVPADVDNGSNDACGIQSIELDISNFDCANLGENTVILTVTDVNGNVSSNEAIVTVIDNIAPIVGTQSMSVTLDANGNATITPKDVLILTEDDVERGDSCTVTNADEHAMCLDDYNKSNRNDYHKGDSKKNSKNRCNNGGHGHHNEDACFSFDANQGNVIKNLDGSMIVTGTLVNPEDANDIWEVTLNLQNPKNWTDWSAQKGKYKGSKKTIRYSYKDWMYFQMAQGSKLTGAGNNAGNETLLTQKHEKYGVQVGDNANLENGNYGLFASFYYINKNGKKEKGEFSFDISNCEQLPVPEGTVISSDNCSIASTSLDIDTFGCDNLGENTVQVSVTDQSGNTTTQSVIVNVLGDTPVISIDDFYTANGQKKNTIFLGYSDYTYLKTEVSGGSGFTYEWTDESGDVISTDKNPKVTPEITSTYTVVVTNSNGCQATASIEVCVIDARAKDRHGRFNDKVIICHHTAHKHNRSCGHNGHNDDDDDDDDDHQSSSHNNHQSKDKLITVSRNAVKGHLKHGDVLGGCEATCATEVYVEPEIVTDVNIYPNPSTGSFYVKLENFENKAVVLLYTIQGRLIEYKNVKDCKKQDKVKMGSSRLREGIYVVKIRTGGEVFTGSVIIERSNRH